MPLPSSSFWSESSGTPQLSANAVAARVGWPAASKDAVTGGPFRRTSCSGCREVNRFTHTAIRRGVAIGLNVSVRQIGLHQAFLHAGDERQFELAQCLRRQLLGADLDQKVSLLHLRLAHAATSGAADFFSIGKPNASRLA